ncbi:uncharacterized protein LOC108913056 [Anoplophora glabripennis]|uniref:uncharacterized protein LOC108913056 n=1 Tax=Anoplophora glabripennis TaxID=217634 RepID=UPI0008754FBC|nr:uncharacterized protein LOC108913056 [Anoplophora glabripennis]
MRLSLLFLVLASALVVENINADKLNLAPILKLGLRLVLINLKRLESVTLVPENDTWTIPVDLKNISTGSINFKNAQVYGFQTLDIAGISANDADPSNENNIIDLCVNLLFDQLGISTNYDADIGLIDEIPIYGDGKINLAVSQVILDLCLNINISPDFSQISVDDVALSLELHNSPSYITKFWKNDSFSEILSTIINTLEKIIFMWMDYEKECTSSLISPIVQYALNSILPNDIDSNLVINSTCLEESVEEVVDLYDTLKELIAAYNEGSVTNLISSINAEQVKEAMGKMEKMILEILDNE